MSKKDLLKKVTPKFLLDWYHYLLPLIGSVIYGFPSRNLIVIGVTGTSGKSTTVDFITRILEESGARVASISSVRFKIADKEWQNKLKMTTPGRFAIQKFLRQAKNANCKYVVLEIASEGIKQHRHKFIYFDTAVFTNLTPEHLDSHGGFENYRNAKLKLFKATKNIHVINADDKNAQHFIDIPAQKTVTFGVVGGDIKAGNITHDNGILTFKVNNTDFTFPALGQFNVFNALAAISVAQVYGVSLQTCAKALEKVKGMPGRLEVVAKDPKLVVVDYAFTPDQLEASYASVKKFSGQKSLVCVLGSCGGGRDKWKRPVLGKIAGQNCREIIITNEDPYDEDPWEIMEQVAGGLEGIKEEYHLILDRKEAIKKALSLATPSDAVIITGKGAEPLMCLENGKKIPWSDRQVVLDVLDKKI